MSKPANEEESGAPGGAAQLRAPEDLSTQLNACELLLAMWGADDGFQLEDEVQQGITNLAKYLALPVSDLGGPQSVEIKNSLPSAIVFSLPINADPNQDAKGRTLLAKVTLSLRKTPESSLRPRIQLERPSWLTRAQYDSLVDTAALNDTSASDQDEDEDPASYVLSAIERISEALLDIDVGDSAAVATRPAQPAASSSRFVVRTWYHFPSLSSKEKRADLVAYAEHHNPPLTGFILAGKPGLAVLEAPLPDPDSDRTPEQQAALVSQATASIDRYWSKIRSSSWADIPAGHKKVSLRLTEDASVGRIFTDIEDVTDSEALAGGQTVRAHRPNRNDLSYLERWLEGKGLGGRLEGVLGADWK
ncbi:hypothetical protein OC845_004766 [Tilletia horrida]|nr:hypothetical protein OC845_004766 [Tilletia horrida]